MKPTKNVTPSQVFWLIIVILILHDMLIIGYLTVFNKEGGNKKKHGSADDSQQIKLEDMGPAPAFSLTDLQGNTVSLENLKGKVVLVDFWGTWCKSCCEEMPDMDKVYQRYKDKGFEMVAIAIEFEKTKEEQLAKVEKKVKKMGVTCTIVLGDDTVVKAFGGKLENFPQTYLIDRQGKLRKAIVGARSEDFWDELIASAVNL